MENFKQCCSFEHSSSQHSEESRQFNTLKQFSLETNKLMEGQCSSISPVAGTLPTRG